MANIYFVRHGESLANADGIYQGQTYDTDLSPRGKKQAEKLTVYFNKINVNRIIVSPLKRTRQTAKPLLEKTKLALLVEKEIIETNHGDWEGKHKDFISRNWPGIYQEWVNLPANAAFPHGETFKETQGRILKWWKRAEILEGNTVVITHDNVIRIIVAEILGLNLNNIWGFDLLPTAVTIVETKNGIAKLGTLNDTRHLDIYDMDITAHAL